MTTLRVRARIATWFLLAAGLSLGAGAVLADANGRTGLAQSANGCSCHGNSRTATVGVAITGPQSVTANSTNLYTVTVTGGPATSAGGFDLKTSGGTLTAGANNRVSGTDVTHGNANVRSWTFSWKAPATAGTQNFWAIGVAADAGDDDSGDQWNWYGGAVNTPFAITVTGVAGVGEQAPLTWLAPPSPNPCANGARIEFSLASPADVRLELLDTAGRRVRALARGEWSAGRQSVTWDGRSADGARVAAGVYFVRLTTPGHVLTTRLAMVD